MLEYVKSLPAKGRVRIVEICRHSFSGFRSGTPTFESPTSAFYAERAFGGALEHQIRSAMPVPAWARSGLPTAGARTRTGDIR